MHMFEVFRLGILDLACWLTTFQKCFVDRHIEKLAQLKLYILTVSHMLMQEHQNTVDP